MSQVKRVRQGFDLMELGKEYVPASDYDEMKSAGYQLLEALGLCLFQLERESMPSDEVMHAMHHARAAICKSADLARAAK